MAVNAQGVRLSSKPDADAIYYAADSEELRQDRVQSAAAATTVKKWAPWVIGLLVVGGGAYWYLRD